MAQNLPLKGMLAAKGQGCRAHLQRTPLKHNAKTNAESNPRCIANLIL